MRQRSRDRGWSSESRRVNRFMTLRVHHDDIEELRRLASEYGIPLDVVDRLSLRPAEVARTTGIGERTVRRWIETGRLRASKIDTMVVVPVIEVLRFLEENQYVARPQQRPLRERAIDFIEKAS